MPCVGAHVFISSFWCATQRSIETSLELRLHLMTFPIHQNWTDPFGLNVKVELLMENDDDPGELSMKNQLSSHHIWSIVEFRLFFPLT